MVPYSIYDVFINFTVDFFPIPPTRLLVSSVSQVALHGVELSILQTSINTIEFSVDIQSVIINPLR